MKLGKTVLTNADPNAFRTLRRLLLLGTLTAAQWGCMESGSPAGSQSQATAVRMAASNPLCRTQTHLLILDRDAIANGGHCTRPADTGKECRKDGNDDRGLGKDRDGGKHGDRDRDREKDERARDAAERNKSKGGSGSHGGRGGSGGFEEEITLPAAEADSKSADAGATASGAAGTRGTGSSGGLGKSGSEGRGSLKCDGNHGIKGHNGRDCDRKHGNNGNEGDARKCETSFVGNRGDLLAFADRIGTEITLPAGTLGDEGWFAVTTVRIGWKSAGPDYSDGLRNYVEAGPGLGSPDAKGNRETLLDKVPNLSPLRATGLARLEGRSVCAVVLDGEVKMGYGPVSGDIRGPNLGKLAFQVLSVQSDARNPNALPSVRVRILDADAVCGDPLTPFLDAPAPVSAYEPRDIVRPACVIQQDLVSEPWNIFDSTVWSGDGDQVVENGLFFAREGASSSVADWISPCPVGVDSGTAIRFTNRLQLMSPAQNEFAESGALFFINAGPEGTYDNYVFVNVGYTMSPSKVFVELFGSDGGTDFDQYEETNIPFSTSQLFNVDLWILRDAYHIAVANEMIDTVTLASPLTSVGLFETGVQQNSGGLRGLLDMTTITKLCRTVNVEQKCKRHSPHRTRKRERLGTRCRTRNQYVRMAKEKIKHCARPSHGLQALAKMRERPEFD